MGDSEPTHDNPRNTRNLPAVVPAGEVMRPTSESWLTRAIRTLFGWKPGSVRDDLQVVLDASTPDEVGFSATERTMLRNILGLHERRIADVMIHRADIVAVKRDIPLGELMGLFESAAHSRHPVSRRFIVGKMVYRREEWLPGKKRALLTGLGFP